MNEDELIELDFCCPECHCSQWIVDSAGLYICARCDYVLALDQEDPNCDDFPLCPRCKSTNISLDSAFGFYKCSDCFTAWVDPENDPNLMFACTCGNRLLTWSRSLLRPYCERCDTSV